MLTKPTCDKRSSCLSLQHIGTSIATSLLVLASSVPWTCVRRLVRSCLHGMFAIQKMCIRQRWAFAMPGSEAIVAVWALRRHASCCSRSRGLKVCDRWLRVHGLPGTKRGRVQWPKLVPRRVFNGCLRAVKTQLLQSCHPVVAKWLAESLQPVLPPQSNYTRRWNHIRACRYWCQSHWFDMSPAELQLTSQDAQAVLENANLGAHRNSREACRVQTASLDPLPAGNCSCRMGA